MPPSSSCSRISRSATDRATRRPGVVRTGEAHHVDVGADERGTDGAAADDRLHDVDRDARAVHEVDEPQPGERRVLRRLVEHRVAGEQRGDDRVEPDEVRVVPRADVRDEPDRLVRDALLDDAGAARR